MDPLKKAVAKGKSKHCQTGSLSCSGRNDPRLSPCPRSPCGRYSWRSSSLQSYLGDRAAQRRTENWGWTEINQPSALDDYYLILLFHQVVQEWLFSDSLLPSVFITRNFSVKYTFLLCNFFCLITLEICV